MFQQVFSFLDTLDDQLWSYLGVPIIVILGVYLTLRSGFIQIRAFPRIVRLFFTLAKSEERDEQAVHPIKAFFAAVGGCIGIGNIVGVCTAVQLGGPGALFWIWVTATAGMMIKYAEVYLGMRFRVGTAETGYKGGPMYFLREAFKSPLIPNLVCLLLCVYGIEVYQFRVVVDSVTENFALNPYFVIFGLLFLVIYAGIGGVKRVGAISSTIIPVFVTIYSVMGIWILIMNYQQIPAAFSEVFAGAFTGHAALGGFLGSTLIHTISQGVRRGCYTGDVGVGYASVIHSESSETVPEKQASLAIFGIFLDTFIICTTTILIILVTGVWSESISAPLLVQTALANYFPYIHFFMPLFLFLLGYSTINAYFVVGLNCADYLSPRWGRKIYFCYAVLALLLFSFADTSQALTVMSLTLVLLLIINTLGIFLLRDKISYKI